LLLGLIREKDCRADVVGSLLAKIPDPCELLGIQHRPATEIAVDKKKGPRLDGNSKKALAYAAKEAELDQQYWIDTDHLLRALLCFPNEASPALDSITLDLSTVRVASERNRTEFPPDRKPLFKAYWWWIDPLKRALLRLALIALIGLVAALMIRWLNY
jgi:hypothetical protein